MLSLANCHRTVHTLLSWDTMHLRIHIGHRIIRVFFPHSEKKESEIGNNKVKV